MALKILFLSSLICWNHADESTDFEAMTMLQRKASNVSRIILKDHTRQLPGWFEPVPPDRPADWLQNISIENFMMHAQSSIMSLGNSIQAKLADRFLDWQSDFNAKFVAIEGIVYDSQSRSTDQIAIYRRNDECVLTVSGSDDVQDAKTDFDTEKMEACGTEVHRGFWKEAEAVNLALNVEGGAMWRYFTGHKCKKRYVQGHSLGGVVAQFMTICMRPLHQLQIDGLVTYGSPGSTVEPIPVWGELNFPTKRYWTTRTADKKKKVDVVPILLSDKGFGHPKMTSIRLDEKADDEWVAASEKKWDEEGATIEPHPEGELADYDWNFYAHMLWVYEEAITSTN